MNNDEVRDFDVKRLFIEILLLTIKDYILPIKPCTISSNCHSCPLYYDSPEDGEYEREKDRILSTKKKYFVGICRFHQQTATHLLLKNGTFWLGNLEISLHTMCDFLDINIDNFKKQLLKNPEELFQLVKTVRDKELYT
jgi:hypothetical protein